MAEDFLARFVKKHGRLPTEVDPDYLEMVRMSKYVLEATPRFKPGKCANCGASKEDGRRYVSFGLEIDWYGVVYICTLCLHDIAFNSGLFDSFRKEIQQLETKVTTIESLHNEARGLVDKITSLSKDLEYYDASLRAFSNYTDSDRPADVVSIKKTYESLSGSDGDSTETESGSAEPFASRRLKDIPSLTSLINRQT